MRRLIGALSCLLTLLAGVVALQVGVPATSQAVPAAAPEAGSFRSIASFRVLDTRTGSGLGAARQVRFSVGNRGNIPGNAAAVTINITVLTPARSGSVSVFPGGTAWNGAASISFVAGQTKQSQITAKLGSDGSLTLRNNIGATIQVIGDVTGLYLGGTPTAPGSFRAIGLQRTYDTRAPGTNPLWANGSETPMTIAGRGAIPASGVAGVVANLTVLNPGRSGSVSTYSDYGDWDGSASVSFAAGKTEQDVLSISVNDSGYAVIRNNTGVDLQVVLDVIGYYLAGTPAAEGAYQPVTSSRVLDQRVRIPGVDSRLQPGQVLQLSPAKSITNVVSSVPRWGVPAAVIRFTLITPARAGSFSVFPGDQAWNRAASISFAAGISVQQQLISSPGPDGQVQLRNNSSYPLTVVADVLGYYFGVANPLQLSSHAVIDPQRGSVRAVSCPTTTFCMAVESGGYALTWNGTSWSAPAKIPQASSVSDVSCASASFCIVVDLNRLYRYDGTGWSLATTLTSELYPPRVSCASAAFCLATEYGRSRTFDGSQWSADLPSGISSTALSCASATFCVAAGTNHALYSFDGSSWSAPVATPGLTAWAVSCTSATFCAAVGPRLAATFNGTDWTVTSNLDPSHALLSVSCTSDTDCRAVDSIGQVVSFDGQFWADPVPADPNGGLAIDCASANLCMLVDGSTHGTDVTFDGATWSAPQTIDVPPGLLLDVSCTSASFCVAVDGGGYALRYDGSSWSTPVQLTDGAALLAVSCVATNRCVAVDVTGRAVHFDGTSWSSPVPVDPGQRLEGVSCASASFCVAVGGDGKASRYDGTAWSTPAVVSSQPLAAVSCPSTTFCLATDAASGAATFNGTGWTTAASAPPGSSGRGLSCSSATYCFTAGSVQAAEWLGSRWSTAPTVPNAAVVPSCFTYRGCHVLDEGPQYPGSYLTDWIGNGWTMPVSLPGFFGGSQSSISCPVSDFCMALDGKDQAYRLDG